MKPHLFTKDAAQRLSLAEVMDVAKGGGADMTRAIQIQLVRQQGELRWSLWQDEPPHPGEEN